MTENLLPRPLRRHVKVYDSPAGDKWRGAYVQSIVGGTATIGVLAEASFVRTFTGPLTDVPVGAQSIGAPLVVRLTGAPPYVLAEIQASSFDGADGPPSNVAAAIAAGKVFYGIVPRSITGESEVIDWAAEDKRTAARVDAVLNAPANQPGPNPMGGKS